MSVIVCTHTVAAAGGRPKRRCTALSVSYQQPSLSKYVTHWSSSWPTHIYEGLVVSRMQCDGFFNLLFL